MKLDCTTGATASSNNNISIQQHLEGLDLQADGGTHVQNTSEVGYIKMIGHESKGKSNKRLRIEVE